MKTKRLSPKRLGFRYLLLCCVIIFSFSSNLFSGVSAKVNVIIDKLPIDKEQKMKSFHIAIKEYVDNIEWLEEDDDMPIEISFQLFLTESPSTIEDRYNCEFLISSNDVQYFDRRVRFAYDESVQLIYNEQSVDPLTGVINFYVNMILGSELDKYRGFGGDVYYKKASNFAALGKFVRTEFIRGSTEREELIKRVFQEPFITFRKMKDYYFYGMYALEEDKNVQEARSNVKTALDMLEKVLETKSDSKVELTEPQQFLDAHYVEIIDLFKDYSHRNEIFKKLIKIDSDHREQYEQHVTDS